MRPAGSTAAAACFAVLTSAGCGDRLLTAPTPPAPIEFPAIGALAGATGQGSFRFGVATAATQIEDRNASTDWELWTRPVASGGLGKGTYVGDAVRGYTLAPGDVQLVHELGVDSYRFSIEWARIEPVRDQIDEAAIAHYRDELVALTAMGIRPLVTLHHFSNPVWVADPRAIACPDGPSDTNLCGFGSAGAPQIIDEMAEHARLMATRFGDLVDEWGTVNEPINYLLAAYGTATFPPGKLTFDDLPGKFIPIVRDYVAAHAAMYRAIHEADTIDADGDGVAAAVGLSVSVADWEPARGNLPSTNPEDLAGRDRVVYAFHYLFVDAVVHGTFDTNFDGVADEQHPEWASTVDWLGLQYYFRAGVTSEQDHVILPALNVTPCFAIFDLGACLPAPDPSYCVPRMGYEGWIDGLGTVIDGFTARYPGLPLVVSEAGIATEVGARRAQNIVRVLEVIAAARERGADVRGYYHWSLTDNFEWAEGFGPHFGLYHVDYATYARTPTEGATVLGAIASSHTLSTEQRIAYGGTGPMAPEPGFELDPYCTKVPAN